MPHSATPGAADEKRLASGELRAILLEAREIADGFDDVVVSGHRGTRQKVAVRVYALGAVGAARELADGVAREVDARAPANGMRLARHLFEQDIDLHYLLNHPAAAIRQFEAREAKSRLDLDRKVKELALPADLKKEFKTKVKHAYRLDDLARQRQEAKGGVEAADRGFPTYEHKAIDVDRADDYAFFYAGASWFSHPGVKTVENHLLVDEGRGTARIRPTGSDPVLSEMALTLGLKSVVAVIERANWCLGPFAGLQGRLGSLLERTIPEIG